VQHPLLPLLCLLLLCLVVRHAPSAVWKLLSWVRDEALRARMPQTPDAWQQLSRVQTLEKLSLAKEGGGDAWFNMWHASALSQQQHALQQSAAAQKAGRAYDDIDALHLLSSHHVDLLQEYKLLGCFSCMAMISLKDVEEFTDRGQTALCPHCSVDAIIPLMQHGNANSGAGAVLPAMHEKWFAIATATP
jgi:hypothetical protein